MNLRKRLVEKRFKREKRNRAKIFGRADSPRLSVFRSNYYIYAQLIDDEKKVTLAFASSRDLKKTKEPILKTKEAETVGALIAEKAKKLGIKKVVFDRGSYAYHGRVKALADGARKGGLKF